MATRSEWSQALWSFYYPVTDNPRPVYLSMDDEDLVSIGLQLLGSQDLDEIKRDLIDVTFSDMQLDLSNKLVFTRIASAAKSWRTDNKGLKSIDVSPPPQLPFLAVTVLAAREIGGDSTNSLGFYLNLRKLLGIRLEFEGKLQSAYTSVIEELWGGLNKLLIDLKYKRGIPTATAITHRFVSIPISQSIVRRHDRRKLAEFFLDSDLRPDSVVSQSELQQLFQWWLSRGGHSISANLEGLWRRGKIERDRVLDVIAQELQVWDGASPQVSDGVSRVSQLKVFLVRDVDWFGDIKLQVGLIHQAPSALSQDSVQLVEATALGEFELNRVNATSFFALSASDFLTDSQVLLSNFEFESAQLGKIRKSSKSIYVLSFNPELQCFVEQGRPNLGESVMVLATTALGIGEKVQNVLSEYADEGLSELSEEIHGLEGWRVFQDVKFAFPFSNNADLAPLSTNTNPSLVFTNGLKLIEEPGVRVWSRHWLPVIDATVPEGAVINLKIFSEASGEPREPLRHKHGYGRAQIELRGEPLPDGEYAVELSLSGATEQVFNKSLSIRSEASPRTWEEHPGEILGYSGTSFSAPHWRAAENSWCAFPEKFGPYKSSIIKADLPRAMSWTSMPQPSSEVKPKVTTEFPRKENCSFSGAHRWNLGTCDGKQRYVDAVCVKCGSQRREACKQWLVLKPEEAKFSRNLPLARAVPIEIEETQKFSSVNNAQIMALHKSLRFLRTGTYKEIKEAAASIGLDALQTRKFVRWLEVSGSLEIANHHDEGASWSLNRAAAIEVGHGDYRLIGNFGPEHVRALQNHLSPSQIVQNVSPYGINVALLKVEEIEDLVESAGLHLFTKPTEKLASWTGPISNWLDGRALEQAPNGLRLEKFNVKNASWQDVETGRIGAAGAYRVKGLFAMSTFYVPENGLDRNMGYRMDAVASKYLDCFFKGEPLIAYDPDSEFLYVPLGMELPGLLGRLAVAASGKPPLEVRRKIESRRVSVIRYENISLEMASTIYRCLGGNE